MSSISDWDNPSTSWLNTLQNSSRKGRGSMMNNPSVGSQVAKDVIKHVKGETEWLDARFSPGQSMIPVISPVSGLARMFISLRSP